MTDTDFPIVEQIASAGTAAAAAALLLRVPDALLLSHPVQIGAACQLLGFDAGVAFVMARSTALHALRDAHGLMPDHLAQRIERLRVELSRLAAGTGGQGG